MKQSFFILLAMAFAVSVSAQKNLQTQKAPNYLDARIDMTSNGGMAPYAKLDVGGVPIGGSQNIYGVMLGNVHQVSYVPEINTVAFIHRALNAGGGNSGELAVDFSTDGGSNWTTEAWITQQMNPAPYPTCRYPSMSLFNPDGNTDVANARIVANGPALCPETSSWGYSFQIDATIEATPVTNEYYGSVNGDNTDFHPYGIEVGPDGTVWSASIGYLNEEYMDFMKINKATYNETEDKFDWATPINFDLDLYYEGTDFIFNGWDVTVHPTDPNIVFAIASGCFNGDPMTVPTPHVWKSTDGGENWTLLNVLDFTAEPFATELDQYIIYNVGEPMRPYVSDIDATVDADGRLHIFSEVLSGTPDFGYIYSDVGDSEGSYSHYIDFHTTDGTDWEMNYVHPMQSLAATWGDVSTYQHPTVGRTPDAEDIVYMWSETYQDADSLNTNPNIMMRSWNTTSGIRDTENLTAGSVAAGLCFFPQFSPIVKDLGDGWFEIPATIAMIDFVNGSDLDPVNYFYLTGLQNTPTSVNDVVNENSEVMVYPNPVADKVFVNQGNGVAVYNILGAKVYEATAEEGTLEINMSQFTPGTYIFQIQTENGVINRKVIKK